jgi:hypothetical protein
MKGLSSPNKGVEARMKGLSSPNKGAKTRIEGAIQPNAMMWKGYPAPCMCESWTSFAAQEAQWDMQETQQAHNFSWVKA